MSTRAKKKTAARMDAERVRQALQSQSYILRGFTAETLSAASHPSRFQSA